MARGGDPSLIDDDRDADDGPIGLEASTAFVDYMEGLRETWPANEELAAKHVEPDGNRHSEDSRMSKSADPSKDVSQPTTDSPESPEISEREMGRRRFMQATAATAVAVVGASGSAAAAGGGLNYESDLSPNPKVTGTVEISDATVSGDALGYVDNNGNAVSLTDIGGRVAERDEDDEPHNPVTLSADRIDVADYVDFPRGETFDDGDDEDADLNAIDAQHWTESAGMTVSDTTAASGGDALTVEAAPADGEVETARFEDFSITSGELRRYLQLVVNVEELSGTVEVRVEDSTGAQETAEINADADPTADSTIATGADSGAVYQTQLGDLAADDLDGIEALEIAILDASATVEFVAINVERESSWTFGSEEKLDSDDDLVTDTVEEPTGEFSITSISTMGSTFDSATIDPLTVDVELVAEGVSDSWVDIVDADPGRFRFEARTEIAQNLEVPTAYDLSWSDLELVEEVRHPSDRYNEVLAATGLDSTQTVEEVDDIDTTDETSTFENGSVDSEIVVSTDISPGDYVLLYSDLLLTDDEDSEITSTAAVGGPVGGASESSFIQTPLGMASTIGAGVVGYFGVVRGWFTGLIGGS